MSAPTLELARWTASSGSGVRSRAAVVLVVGDHQWESTAEGVGPVSALMGAIDNALHNLLGGHPRLLAYDVHAIGVGPGADAAVSLTLMPPAGRGEAQHEGHAQAANLLAATASAYVEALNALLADPAWAGDPATAGGRRRHPGGRKSRAEAGHDPDPAATHEIDWFPH